MQSILCRQWKACLMLGKNNCIVSNKKHIRRILISQYHEESIWAKIIVDCLQNKINAYLSATEILIYDKNSRHSQNMRDIDDSHHHFVYQKTKSRCIHALNPQDQTCSIHSLIGQNGTDYGGLDTNASQFSSHK